MKVWTLPLIAALAAAGLQGCDRQETITTVTPPAASLPEETAATPAAPASAPQVTPMGEQTAAADAAGPAALPASAPAAAASAPEMASAPPLTEPPPATAAMGAQPAVTTPDGVAAPTEISRALDAARTGAAGQDKAAQDKTPQDKAQQKAPEKVSLLPTVRSAGDAVGARLLAQQSLQLPVAGVQPTALSDQFELQRGQRKHEAIDILAPTGTPVVAVEDGRIAKLFTSKAGGLTIYQFDKAERLAYYYAHLQGYAPTVREGVSVKRGDLLGYVGSTGNADPSTPHLHFAVFRLGEPVRWWEGEPVNPYPALRNARATETLAER